MNIIKFCNRYIRSERKKVCLYVIISLSISMLSLFVAIITGKFLDILIDGKNLILVKQYLIKFAIISILLILFSLIKNYLYTLVQTKTAYRINRDVVEHIKMLPRKEYLEMNFSYFNQRINNDSNSIVSFYLNVIVDPITSIIYGLVSIVIIFGINRSIAVILVLSYILYVILYKVFKQKLYTLNTPTKKNRLNIF